MVDYRVGAVVKGKITGIQKYGAFVELDFQTQGLIHISEITHGFVKDIHDFILVGDEVEVRILSVDQESGKISLSLRDVREMTKWKKRSYIRLPKATPHGFSTLKKKLAEWIKEAQ